MGGGLDVNDPALIKSAASKWNNVSGINLNYSGFSGNNIWEENIDSLGRTTVSPVSGTKQISKVNMIIDSRSDWQIGGSSIPSTKYDYYTVVLHEFGHWFMLNDDSSHNSVVMNGTLDKGKARQNLQAEDIEAAVYIYGK